MRLLEGDGIRHREGGTDATFSLVGGGFLAIRVSVLDEKRPKNAKEADSGRRPMS